jgi:hypothetical protein
VITKKTKEEFYYGNKGQIKTLKHTKSSKKYDVAQEVVHDDMMKNVERKLQWNVQRFTSHSYYNVHPSHNSNMQNIL